MCRLATCCTHTHTNTHTHTHTHTQVLWALDTTTVTTAITEVVMGTQCLLFQEEVMSIVEDTEQEGAPGVTTSLFCKNILNEIKLVTKKTVFVRDTGRLTAVVSCQFYPSCRTVGSRATKLISQSHYQQGSLT